ncbi:hypothetical protein, partial [Salmonella enterica]|uniref:hypothetical protein n=1 Tax=Salmonella enterica TaxID=28901 RepID=UPI003D2B807B
MIKLPGQWPVRWLYAGLFLVCWSGAARSEERIDPSDPTAVHANVSFLPEFRAMPGGGSVSGTRIDLNQG